MEVNCNIRKRLPLKLDPATECLTLRLSRTPTKKSVAQFFAQLPPGIKLLDLSMCRLGGLLPKNPFARLHELRFLNLEFNQLTSLPESVFQGSDNLRTLWLTGNHWRPEEEGYSHMAAQANKISVLPEDTFVHTPNLEVLLMHHNALQSLPASLFVPIKDSIKVLKLVDNAFEPRLGPDTAALQPLLNKKAAALRRCRSGMPSDGSCLQLDIRRDSGDTLEDVWEALGVEIASSAVVEAAMQEMQARGGVRTLLSEGEGEGEGHGVEL